EIVLVNGDTPPQPLQIADLRQIMEPQPIIEDWVWDGRATFSLELDNTESRKRDLDIDVTTEARHGDWRHVLSSEFERDYRDDINTRQWWDADYTLCWYFVYEWCCQVCVS